ncbi:MAG: rhomboid family intramembrane serine protease [Cyclobacteriaceae bacterium]|nr:rhomboid family intramembrane serine protease [Cyclobacteriaceae bacterium HetDA_MAG_MS6]
MWLMFAIQFSTGYDLGFLGISPRTINGLIGIFTAPLIHGNLNHLISNTLPMLFLGATLYLFFPRIASQVFIQCYFLTNLFVWVFARPFYHIGASGLVYGIAFFLISFGWFTKHPKSILVSVVVVLIYGGLVYGVLPLNSHISWESHLMGAIVGVGSAYGISKARKS